MFRLSATGSQSTQKLHENLRYNESYRQQIIKQAIITENMSVNFNNVMPAEHEVTVVCKAQRFGLLVSQIYMKHSHFQINNKFFLISDRI